MERPAAHLVKDEVVWFRDVLQHVRERDFELRALDALALVCDR
jgi:hypothetical protein